MKNNIKQAVILVGGFGTRLRPLSLVIPKPIIPIINKPLLEYHIDNFIENGIEEIIFCMSYKSDLIKKKIKSIKKNVKFIFVNESTPLGTGGAIKNAQKYLDEVFIAINGDVFSSFDLNSLVKYYYKNNPDIIIGTREVDNPSKFGLLKITNNRKITEFLEKPSGELDIEIGLKEINAGIYIIKKDLIRDFNMKEFSIERNFFPDMLNKNKNVLGFKINSYWNDVGTSEEYFKTSFLVLNKNKKNLYLGKNVKLGKNIRFIGNNIIMDEVKIDDNVELENTIIFNNVKIEKESKIKNCVLSPKTHLGKFIFISGMVLGSGTYIDDYSFLNRSLL